MTLVEHAPDTWEWEAELMSSGEDRPIVVAYDIRDILQRIENKADTTNTTLALKANKAEVDAAIRDVKADVARLQTEVTRTKGWRDGFLVAAGLSGGIVGSVLLHAAHVI